jgi:hypothetical protein
MKPGKIKNGDGVTATASDYMKLWLQKEAEVQGRK